MAALVLAAARSVAIDVLRVFIALCATSVLGACLWAFLFRHRRQQHISRRGHP